MICLVTDPLLKFAELAQEQVSALNISQNFIFEAIKTLKDTLGEDWLNKTIAEEQAIKNKAIFNFIHNPSKNPLSKHFVIPGDSDIIEILELAAYIKALNKVSGFSIVLENLKHNYYPNFMQMSFAYRFLQMGAQNLELEPLADNNRVADIYFELENMKFMTECYIAEEMLYKGDEYIFQFQNELCNLAMSLGLRLDVNFRFLRDINEQNMKTCISAAKLKIQEQAKHLAEHNFTLKNSHLELSIQNMALSSYKKPKMMGGDDDAHDSVFIYSVTNRKIMTSDDKVNWLSNKLKNKLNQTKRKDEPINRLVIAETDESRQLARPKDAAANKELQLICARVMEYLTRNHSNIYGIFLCDRIWTEKKRFQYNGAFLVGNVSDPKNTLLDKLNENERLINCFD